jgi:hypothetical protein
MTSRLSRRMGIVSVVVVTTLLVGTTCSLKGRSGL